MRCPICEQKAESAFATGVPTFWQIEEGGRKFRYVRCANCELIFADPLPLPGELDLYYSTKYDFDWFAKRRLLKRVQAYHRWQRVGHAFKNLIGHKGTLLDVGSGHGWFMEAAKRFGWDVTGLEMSTTAGLYCRNVLDLNVINNSIERAELPQEYYDIITMWHSLEHMINPQEVFKKVRSALKPDGILMIGVPNVSCRGMKRQGAGWGWLQLPFVHIWHFSPKALAAYLNRAGFQVINTQTHDTWDAQYLFDDISGKVVNRYCMLLARICASVFKRLGFRYERVFENIYFYAYESARICFYCFYLCLRMERWRSQKDAGSELVVMARKTHFRPAPHHQPPSPQSTFHPGRATS